MATVRILGNILDSKVDTFTAEAGTTVEEIIREHTDGNAYDGVLVECYDLDSGKTYFAPFEEDTATTSAIVQVNEKEAEVGYRIAADDIVCIVITPSGGGGASWSWTSAWAGAVSGLLSGAGIGSAFTWVGTIVGGVIGFAVGFVAGGLVGGYIEDQMKAGDGPSTSSSGLSSQQLPDVRGSQNQSLTDQTYPMVLGKHLATPFIIGSPWNEIRGKYGTENYINILYAVGYAPLRLTDFKLGEMFLAHNQPWSGNGNLRNIFHGALRGTDSNNGSGEDSGEIVNTWKSNDVTIEILQQDQGGGSVDYGNIYPYAKIQEDIKANVLFIASGSMEEIDRKNSITYKGVGLANGLRNNPVRFSEQFPYSLKVELDFGNGLYKSRSENRDNTSEVKYYQIPLWVAVQWRVYSEQNDRSDGEEAGRRYGIPEYDYENRCYKPFSIQQGGKPVSMVKRDWNSFSRINDSISVETYTGEARYIDLGEHTGNDLRNEKEPVYNTPTDGSAPILAGYVYGADVNEGWIDEKAFNLQELGGTNENQDGINEFRCVTEVDLVQWARENLRSPTDTEEQFAEKFRSYFYDGTNTTKSIEVRVVRVSPCYIDETVSTQEHSAFKFNDVFTWSTLTSTMIDGDRLMRGNAIVRKRPLSEDRMRRLCVVALRAKTDNTDQLSNTLKKFSCTAQSFAPYYDDEEKTWFPRSVRTLMKYYRPYDKESGSPEDEISESQFYADRQAGIKSVRIPAGNDFVKNMVNDVIRTPSHIDVLGRYFIPNDGTTRYCTNNVASMFLLAGIGPHLGSDALGYVQSGFDSDGSGDFNMPALAKWYKWAEDVTDGSTYSSDGFHYTHGGERAGHRKGDLVRMYFTANAYIYKEETLENMLSKIAVAGRAVYTRDGKNRLTVIIDKPEKYPVALISQQNTLKSSYTISFSDLPSGIQVTFPDEDDGYIQNQLYCMADGEKDESPRGAIEQYKFDYVTNNCQQWSLGRYILANRILNREMVTKQIGMEGASIGLGNLVLVQDDTMLIGTDTGGRITELIETEDSILGFIIDNTYRYTGEVDTYTDGNGAEQTRCVQGVIVMQPSQYKESRVITLRLAKEGTELTADGIEYRMVKGDTNVVLFDTPVSKNQDARDGSDYYVYRPKVGNIVGFGTVGRMTAPYRVIKIKPDSKHRFDLTLMKYQEDLYRYGAVLPSFQNNMTVPDRSGEDSFALSNAVTVDDLMHALAEAGELAQDKIDRTFGDTPPVPGGLTADVRQDCIQFVCTVDTAAVNNIDHISYEILKADGTRSFIDGSYSTEYYFDRKADGFPERSELAKWRFRAKSVSIYVDKDGNRIESVWTDYVHPTTASLSEYGTWIPPKPDNIRFVAEQDGITAAWDCDLTRVYGSVQYNVMVLYDKMPISVEENGRTTVVSRQTVVGKSATYQFNRKADGFPEKPGTPGMKLGTRTLDGYSVIISAENITSGRTTDSGDAASGTDTPCDYLRYKTWIPSDPSISARVSNRNVTMYLSQAGDCYGLVQYLVGVRRYSDPSGTFYVPDLETNPYSRETAYKLHRDGVFIVGKIESETQYTQTMPLETQNGTHSMLDVNESNEDNRVLALPVNSKTDIKVLSIPIGGFAPIDTSYQFEVYAFNKTVENFYDMLYGTDHRYDKDTYNKVSTGFARKNVVALATSVQDVLNGSIVSDKVGTGAITETKIEDDAISTPKLKANAVVADKIYAYNLLTLHNGAHAISGYAYSEDLDDDVRELISLIKAGRETNQNGKPNIELLDDIIRSRSNNFWIGLDTDHPEFYMGNCVVGDKYKEHANYFHYYFENGDTNLDIKLSNFIVTALSSTIKGYFNVRNKEGQIKYTGVNSFLRVNPETRASAGETKDGYYRDGTFYEDEALGKKIEPEITAVYNDITKDEAGNPRNHLYQWNGVSYDRVSATDAETMILKGNLIVDRKNSDGSAGLLTVRGMSRLAGGLCVGNDDGKLGEYTARVFGTLGASGDINSRGNIGADGSISAKGSMATDGSMTVGGSCSAESLVAEKSVLTGTLSVTSASSFGGNATLAAGKKLLVGKPSAGMWVRGRDNAAIRQSEASALWAPLLSMKTRSGSIEAGTSSDDDRLCLRYASDKDYSAQRNTVTELMTIDSMGNVSFGGSLAAGGNTFITAQEAFDAAHPVTAPYIQFPGLPDPESLYNKNGIKSTWAVVPFSGAFFRAEGGGALAFDGGLQSASLPNITGKFSESGLKSEELAEGAFGTERTGWEDAGYGSALVVIKRIIEFDASRSSAVYGRSGTDEVIPENYTFRVWKRIA